MFKEATKRPHNVYFAIIEQLLSAHEQFIGNVFTETEQDPTYFLIPHKWMTSHMRDKDFDNG